MGSERRGYQRISFFALNGLATQIIESSHDNRQTMTAYILQAIIERIKRERKIESLK